jgi:trehalose/maltose hydrolase-like predicted phosphorylase
VIYFRHEPVLPPEDIYPIHDWRLVESRLNLNAVAQTETLFATANGYLGMRGAFEEGSPASQHGTFINGFYESCIAESSRLTAFTCWSELALRVDCRPFLALPMAWPC